MRIPKVERIVAAPLISGTSRVQRQTSNAEMQPRRFWRVPFALAWSVIIWLSLAPAGSVQAMRPGPDIEDFQPPYNRSDPHIVQALAAFEAENDREA